MFYIKTKKHALTAKGMTSSASLGAALLASLGSCQVAAQNVSSTSASSPAQEVTRNEKVVTLPEVQVRAQPQGYLKENMANVKFTTPVSKTPKTIQVIDRELMEDQQTTTLTEALKNTPGVGAFSMGETGSSSTGDAVYMRGIDASGSIFVDGIRDAGSITRDMFNIEQVEVVKGADGSMFGRTALNGTINLVTKQARLEDRFDATLTGGTHKQKRGSLDFNRKLGDTTAMRLNLVGQDNSVPGRDRVKNKTWGIAPAISFGLGTDTRFYLDFLHLQQRNQPDGGLTTLGLPGYHADPDHPEFATAPQPGTSNYYGTRSDYDEVQKDQLTFRFEKDFSDTLIFHNTMRWAKTRQEYMLSSFTSDWDSSWNMNDFSHWQARRVVNTKDQSNSIFTNQAGIVQELKTGKVSHTLSYGLEFSHERMVLRGQDVEPSADNFPINIYHPSYTGGYSAIHNGESDKARMTTVAGYLFDTLEVGDQWQLNGGVRLDHYNLRYKSTDTEALNSKKSKSIVSWQLGALYKINEYGNVYAQYAVAQQPPGNDGLVFESKAKYADRPEYEPQRARTMELGTKWKLAEDRLLFTAALFRTDIDNQVEQDEVTREYVQSGEKRVEGIDLALTGKITPNWDVSLAYTHMKAKVRKGAVEAMDGSDSLNYTPRNAFSGWMSYRLPNGLTVGGGARYVGKMQRDAKGTPATPEYIDSYWVIDAMAKYEVNQNIDIQLNGYNLANKKYVAAINKKGHRYIPGPGRSALLSLRVKY